MCCPESYFFLYFPPAKCKTSQQRKLFRKLKVHFVRCSLTLWCFLMHGPCLALAFLVIFSHTSPLSCALAPAIGCSYSSPLSHTPSLLSPRSSPHLCLFLSPPFPVSLCSLFVLLKFSHSHAPFLMALSLTYFCILFLVTLLSSSLFLALPLSITLSLSHTQAFFML